jgi:L-histidine N-alpha-methyltransferase
MLPIETPRAAEAGRLSIVRLADAPAAESFAEAVRRGLESSPKSLPCQYFYDEAGSELFERICEQPEYYVTRAEDSILREHAPAMVAGWFRAPVMLELGSGSSSKTRRLIGAALGTYGELHYVPIDVSPTILEASARGLVRDFPRLRVTGYAGDYRHALKALAGQIDRPKLLVFLGSSLGNYEPGVAVGLLGAIARSLGPADRLLLGTDLVKDPVTLEAAYDDALGVTAAFNRNLLARINRELGADFDLDRFAHEARYRADLARVEMHLVSRCDQAVRVPGAGLVAAFRAGESIHTESSHKYTPETLADLARRSGFAEETAWTDPRGAFRVQCWRPIAGRDAL